MRTVSFRQGLIIPAPATVGLLAAILPLQDALQLANRVYTYSDKGMPLHAHNYILGDILTQVVAHLPGQHHATT